MAAWMVYNGVSPHPFDAAPYIGLNLILSTVAALQAPFLLRSGNRQAAKDRQRSDADAAVNLKAEHEVTQLHTKIDALSGDVKRLTEMLAAKQQ